MSQGNTLKFMSAIDELIANAPDEADEPINQKPQENRPKNIAISTGVPKRYREIWDRSNTDSEWNAKLESVEKIIKDGGIVALIGKRGTGKTRIAAEAMRDLSPDKGDYTTAMGLFLRIRASYEKRSEESENDIVKEMSISPILILDEVQERSNSAWEDRLLTHILDRRYGAMKPTVLIANLTASALIECLGESITSRLQETGGIMEFAGKSHRV